MKQKTNKMTNKPERKYEIHQVSGSSGGFIEDVGFKLNPLQPRCYFDTAFAGARPAEGKKFYCFYNGNGRSNGLFRIVRQDGNLEVLIDKGTASTSHIHEGKGTLTFYGEGERMDSWSIHCKPEEIIKNNIRKYIKIK
jgi:hypothetical protein